MSKPEIIQPLASDPQALVENVYPIPGTSDVPDLESQDLMGEYLIDRLEPEEGPRTRVVLTPSGRTMPGIQRTPQGYKEVSRWRKTKEWLVSPRQAAAVVLGSMALFNIVGNADTIAGGAKYAGHNIYRVFDPVDDQTKLAKVRKVTPGKTVHINMHANTLNRAGESIVDESAIKQFVDKVEKARQDGATITKVEVRGNTSDEWADDTSIGVKDRDNKLLGQARAQAAAEALEANDIQAKLEISQQEHVLSRAQVVALEKEAKAAGYTDVKSAINAVENGDDAPKSLASKVKRFFSGKKNRGVSISAITHYPGEPVVTMVEKETTVAGVDKDPDVPSPNWYWFLPMVPIRRRERYTKIKPTARWQFTPSQPILKPEVIREEQDQVWLRLRPEAMKKDGTLIDHAWAYSRKYEHLLRDDRIAEVLRADYKNSKDEDKALRIMFIDEKPDQVTVEAFSELLKKFAAMEDGKLSDRVSAMFVYPSENAGTRHGDPKKIAMGIDKQSQENILGTFTYALDLVELHMPASWTKEELLESFKQFSGSTWTLAHEVAGHGTDESDETLRLRRVFARHIPNAHVIDGDPRAQKMRSLHSLLRKLPNRPLSERKATDEPVEFDITYPVIDNAGKVITVRARVQEGDPRLAHATNSTIVDRQPTQYGGTNSSENYAEPAAAVTTGIEIPYGEAHVEVPPLETDAKFATGYRPDARGQKVFTDSVGAATYFPAIFAYPPKVEIVQTNVTEDAMLSAEQNRVRSLQTLRPNQMIAILARVARTSQNAIKRGPRT